MRRLSIGDEEYRFLSEKDEVLFSTLCQSRNLVNANVSTSLHVWNPDRNAISHLKTPIRIAGTAPSSADGAAFNLVTYKLADRHHSSLRGPTRCLHQGHELLRTCNGLLKRCRDWYPKGQSSLSVSMIGSVAALLDH